MMSPAQAFAAEPCLRVQAKWASVQMQACPVYPVQWVQAILGACGDSSWCCAGYDKRETRSWPCWMRMSTAGWCG